MVLTIVRIGLFILDFINELVNYADTIYAPKRNSKCLENETSFPVVFAAAVVDMNREIIQHIHNNR